MEFLSMFTDLVQMCWTGTMDMTVIPLSKFLWINFEGLGNYDGSPLFQIHYYAPTDALGNMPGADIITDGFIDPIVHKSPSIW